MTLRKIIDSNRSRFAIIFVLLVTTQVIDVASTYLFANATKLPAASHFLRSASGPVFPGFSAELGLTELITRSADSTVFAQHQE